MNEREQQLRTMAFWRRQEAKKYPPRSDARKHLLASARTLEKEASMVEYAERIHLDRYVKSEQSQ